jgi:hypothetical protein
MLKVGITLLLLMGISISYAQTCDQKAPPGDIEKMSVLIGEWTGEFTDSGTPQPMSIKFFIDGNELKAEVTNHSFVTRSEIADVSLCSTNKFHFFGSRINGDFFTYNARMMNGELVGNYKVGRNCSKENSTSFRLKK